LRIFIDLSSFSLWFSLLCTHYEYLFVFLVATSCVGVYKTHKWKANASRWRHFGGGVIKCGEIEVGSRSGRQHRDYLIYKCTWTANRYSYRYRFPAPKIQIHLQINRMYLTVCSCEGDSFYVPPHTHRHTHTLVNL